MTHFSPSLPAAPTLVVMGVSGSGKTTVARLLADRLGRPMLEGDDMHSAASVHKMSSGHPLTDEDRWPWLRRIRGWITDRAADGTPGVVACSALRRSFRELLAGEGGADGAAEGGAAGGGGPNGAEDDGVPVVFVYLKVPRDELHRRLQQRTGHYMKAGMLDSQLDTLEPPADDEGAVTVDATGGPGEIAERILAQLPTVEG